MSSLLKLIKVVICCPFLWVLFHSLRIPRPLVGISLRYLGGVLSSWERLLSLRFSLPLLVSLADPPYLSIPSVPFFLVVGSYLLGGLAFQCSLRVAHGSEVA